MKTTEIKHLLHRYFEGETSLQEERELEVYFNSSDVADELIEYKGFFKGLSEVAEPANEDTIEDDILNYINENDSAPKTKKIWLWQAVSGIAASVIFIVGGFLLFQQQESQYAETFEDPQEAYAYAEQTLAYVSAKYNQGLEALSNFDKLQTAAEPIKETVKPVNEYLDVVEKMNKTTSPD